MNQTHMGGGTLTGGPEDGILEWPCERPHGEKTKKVYHHDWKEHKQQSEARKGGRSTGTGPNALDGTPCRDVASRHGAARSTGLATAAVAGPEWPATGPRGVLRAEKDGKGTITSLALRL